MMNKPVTRRSLATADKKYAMNQLISTKILRPGWLKAITNVKDEKVLIGGSSSILLCCCCICWLIVTAVGVKKLTAKKKF